MTKNRFSIRPSVGQQVKKAINVGVPNCHHVWYMVFLICPYCIGFIVCTAVWRTCTLLQLHSNATKPIQTTIRYNHINPFIKPNDDVVPPST